MTRSKTMFASSVCCSDKFVALSFEAQALYYRLNLEADGIGALNNIRSIMRAAGFGEGALSELLDGGYLLHLESGFDDVYLVADFWCHNRIDKHNVGRSEHKEIVLSKCAFQSERIKRYVLVNSGSGCVQSGFSLGSVLNPTLNQPNLTSKPAANPNEIQTAERSPSSSAPCPECGSRCLLSEEGCSLRGWCQLHGDFFIDENGEYAERLL